MHLEHLQLLKSIACHCVAYLRGTYMSNVAPKNMCNHRTTEDQYIRKRLFCVHFLRTKQCTFDLAQSPQSSPAPVYSETWSNTAWAVFRYHGAPGLNIPSLRPTEGVEHISPEQPPETEVGQSRTATKERGQARNRARSLSDANGEMPFQMFECCALFQMIRWNTTTNYQEMCRVVPL